MILNKPLDELFSTWSDIAVMRVLKSYSTGLTGREIARLSKMTPRSAIRALSGLEELGVITRIRGGRDHLFSLNREHFLVKEIVLPVLENEEKFRDAVYLEIRQSLKDRCNSVYVFGSVPRKEEKVESDLDLCVIYDSEEQREGVEEAFEELRSELFIKYGVNASPFYISASEFSEKAKDKKQPVKDIVKEGEMVFGNSIGSLVNG
ncbi:MAG TPA: nucleotidyltransferase domain-containing protein [Ignavibacteriales bacterium]|nr:nucleotidyltransferase domain-containing protein [Ignavibacteriales bacterium]